MKVWCKPADREAAIAAGHKPVTDGSEEAFFMAELPDDAEYLNAIAKVGRRVVCPVAGLDGTEDFVTWNRGYQAWREHHVRKIKAGMAASDRQQTINRRQIHPRTENYIRAMINMSLPRVTIARNAKVSPKTVDRVRRSMKAEEERRK